MSTDLYDSEPDFAQHITEQELCERYVDPDEPFVHEFRAGTILPELCLGCGEPLAAPWHRGLA